MQRPLPLPDGFHIGPLFVPHLRRPPVRQPGKAMHKPPEVYIDRAAMKAERGSELARARIAAHAAFDPLWQSGAMSRRAAYDWLAIQLHLPVSACHMVLMDVAMCQRAVTICRENLECNRAAFDVAAADFEDLTK